MEDHLNWFNHCEQFFRGQHTLASDRVWLVSYLLGAAQTWERFKDLCSIRFGPAIRCNHLPELVRLPFHNTVQDYQERFNELLCHNPQLLPTQKANLFVGAFWSTSASTSSFGKPRTCRRPYI